jgi:hypothetical protein
MGREPRTRRELDLVELLEWLLGDLDAAMTWEARRQRSHDQIDAWTGERVSPDWEARPDPKGPKGKRP